MNGHLFPWKAFYLYLVCFLSAFSGWSIAEEAAENLGENQVTAQADNPAEGLYASPEAVEKWKDLKLGIFITWSPVSMMGTEVSWSRQSDGSGLRGPRGPILPEIYDSLYRSFYPGQFNADEWVRLFRDAGARYTVFVTKHHDGFCFFHSRYTGYDMTATPFKRDIVRELADACHKAGLGLGLYYSHWDWCHPFYRNERHEDYIDYMQKQLDELTRNYGPVMELWFDGRGPAELWNAEETVRRIRRNQPDAMINNRLGINIDFITPEQHIGSFNRSQPWETCMTLGTQWAYKPFEKIKPLRTCIDILVRTVGAGGNLVLNVGPMPTGQIPPELAFRLREIGDWLKVNGESIYGTRGGPFRPGFWGVSTCKDNVIYLHILDRDMFSGQVPIPFEKITACEMLNGRRIPFQSEGEGIVLDTPSNDETDLIVKITLNQPSGDIPLAFLADRGIVPDRITVSSTAPNWEQSAVRLIDGNVETDWWSGSPVKTAWIQCDFDSPVHVNGIKIYQEERDKIESFFLQVYKDEQWVNLFESGPMGARFTRHFDPISADSFRIFISKMNWNAVSLREIRFCSPEN